MKFLHLCVKNASKRHQQFVGWKGEEDYGATLLRAMVLFAPKTAVVGLRHLTHEVNTSTRQQVKFESYIIQGQQILTLKKELTVSLTCHTPYYKNLLRTVFCIPQK